MNIKEAAAKRREEIHQLRQSGWTYKKIGEKFNFSASRAHQLVRDKERRDLRARLRLTRSEG